MGDFCAPATVGEPYNILASFFQNEGLFPKGTAQSQAVLLKLYRMLADGVPVGVKQLAQVTAHDISAIRLILETIPPSNIVWNQAGKITGYRGLGLSQSKHRLIIEQSTLFAWCAFDCLFLPQLLGRDVEIYSACPETGQEIFLKFEAGILEHTDPTDLSVSFVMPDIGSFHNDLRGNFCCFVHFFADWEVGVKWTRKNPSTVLIALEEAMKLAIIRNQKGFGEILL